MKKKTFKNGGIRTYNDDGKLHSFNDEPSSLQFSGQNTSIRTWHKNGKLHRDNGPAYVEIKNEFFYFYKYYKNGLYHNVDGPAIQRVDRQDQGKPIVRSAYYYVDGAYFGSRNEIIDTVDMGRYKKSAESYKAKHGIVQKIAGEIQLAHPRNPYELLEI